MDTPEIDPKLRKPRQLRGTPANRFASYLSLGILGFGCLCGVIYNSIPYYSQFRRDLVAGKYLQPSEAQRAHEERFRASAGIGIGSFLPESVKLREEFENSRKNSSVK